MPANLRPNIFDRIFGRPLDPDWEAKLHWKAERFAWKLRSDLERVAWNAAHGAADRAAWKAQRDAERVAWKAQRQAERAAWRAEHHPFGAVWSVFWTLFWIGFALLMAFSPEFRDGFIEFVKAVPHLLVRFLQALTGKGEV
jgi:hypothetical protein